MRFEVPQFIEIEDKIFGPLTWRQFVYVAGGAGVAAMLFVFMPFPIFLILGLPIAGATFALAFVPVNNRPFAFFLESMFNFFRNKRLYLWQKKGTGIYSDAYAAKSDAPVQLGAYTPPTGSNNITSLSRKLELESIKTEQ